MTELSRRQPINQPRIRMMRQLRRLSMIAAAGMSALVLLVVPVYADANHGTGGTPAPADRSQTAPHPGAGTLEMRCRNVTPCMNGQGMMGPGMGGQGMMGPGMGGQGPAVPGMGRQSR